MLTEVTSETATEHWLEFSPPGASRPKTVRLESFPFTIGRSSSCELPIDSTRVSREHAQIDCLSGTFRLRDLSSTNGTLLNGEQVVDAELFNGDVLSVADVEFTFRQSLVQAPEPMMTQVMGSPASKSRNRCAGMELVAGLRKMQETLIVGGAGITFQPIVHSASGEMVGVEAAGWDNTTTTSRSSAARNLLATESRLVSRLRRQQRQLAVEQAVAGAEHWLVFLEIEPWEMDDDEAVESFAVLRSVAGHDDRLVAEVPDSAVSDVPFFREFVGGLKAMGIAVAFRQFAGGEAQFARYADFAPDYVKLVPAYVDDALQSTERRRGLAELVQAAELLDTTVVASGVSSNPQAELCHDIGCRFALGELYGGPQSMEDILQARCHRGN